MGKTPFPPLARVLSLEPVFLSLRTGNRGSQSTTPDDCSRGISAGMFLIPTILWFTIGHQGHPNELLPKKATLGHKVFADHACLTRCGGHNRACSRAV